METPLLTIFTPAYNRAHTLGALYESLCSQSSKDFEWILVNDGSTDDTDSLARRWLEEGRVRMRYFSQPNAGKMSCHNLAVDKAAGMLLMCLDSDDCLAGEDVVEKCVSFWKAADPPENICGMITYKSLHNGYKKFPEGMDTAHIYELRKAGYMGENAVIVRNDVLRAHKFPVFEGEKFVTDAYIFEQIDRDYSYLLMPFVSQECRYNPDGYSFNYLRLLFSNPQGYREYHNQRIRLGYEGKFKSAICWGAVSIRMGLKGLFTKSASPLLVAAAFPAAVAKYILDSIKLKTFGKVC